MLIKLEYLKYGNLVHVENLTNFVASWKFTKHYNFQKYFNREF